MRTRRIFLLALVVLTVVAVIDGYAGSPAALRGWDRFVVTGPPQVVAGDAVASVSGRLSAPLGGGEVLAIDNPRGSVQVTGEDRTDVAVEYTISVFAANEEQAAEFGRQLQVTSHREGGRLTLEVAEPGPRPDTVVGYAVDYRIAMPRRGRLDVTNRFGRVEVQNVAGPSQVRNEYEATEIRQVEGDWTVHSRFAALKVVDVNGSLRLEGAYGGGKINRVTGPVTGAYDFGALEVEVVGSLDLSSSYGVVEASEARGPVRLELSFSGASVEGVSHDLDVAGRYGDLTVELNPSAPGFRIDAETQHGRLSNRIGALQDRQVVQSGDRQRLEAVLGDGSRMIRVSVQNGNVTLR